MNCTHHSFTCKELRQVKDDNKSTITMKKDFIVCHIVKGLTPKLTEPQLTRVGLATECAVKGMILTICTQLSKLLV